MLIVTIPGYHLDFNAGTRTRVSFSPRLFSPQMKATFYGAGPSFKSKTVKEVNNVDVAPTVAELLGIEPPADAQGKSDQFGDQVTSFLPSLTTIVTCS